MRQEIYKISGKNNLLKNYEFKIPVLNEEGEETGDYEAFLGHKIIIKLPTSYSKQTIGLFLNNNPYWINSDLGGIKQWELDTKGAVSIKSIKFDYITSAAIGSNYVYITVFQD